MEVLDYVTVVLSGVAALTGVIGVLFLWKQTEHLRLPTYRSLDSSERDLLKAMRETGTFIIAAFNIGELIPFILHQAKIDEHGLVLSGGLTVSPHYYEPCLRLRERGIVRKPESNINTNIEYELTPKGVSFLSKHARQLDKHDNQDRFRDVVAIERKRRSRPNVVYGSAHECMGCKPLGSTTEPSWGARITEFPPSIRERDKICDVILPKHVNSVQVGDYIYLRFNQAPLFLDNHDWLQVIVTQIKEKGDHKIFTCGEDFGWAADTSGKPTILDKIENLQHKVRSGSLG